MKSPSPIARPAKNKKIDINFFGGKLTSDAGVLLLQKVDQKLRLTERVKDYERSMESSQATVKLANIALLLRCLAPAPNAKPSTIAKIRQMPEFQAL